MPQLKVINVFNRFERHFLHSLSELAIVPFEEHTKVAFNLNVLLYSESRVYITIITGRHHQSS